MYQMIAIPEWSRNTSGRAYPKHFRHGQGRYRSACRASHGCDPRLVQRGVIGRRETNRRRCYGRSAGKSVEGSRASNGVLFRCVRIDWSRRSSQDSWSQGEAITVQAHKGSCEPGRLWSRLWLAGACFARGRRERDSVVRMTF